MTPRRILAINWQDLKNPQAGGAEVHLQEILSRLGRWGHEVTLLCCGFDGAASEERYDNIRIIRRGKRANFNWIAPGAAKRLMQEQKFDLVVEDINKIPFYTPRFCKVPVLAVVPHLFATTVFHEINFLLATYIYLMEWPVRHFYKNTPFMVISESTKHDLVTRGIPAGMISVVHCGIDHAVYCPDSQHDKYPEPTITYVGRLKRYKSVDHIFAAMQRIQKDFPAVRVEVIGTGDDDARLRVRAVELGVSDRVHFTGYVPVAQKVETLRRSWVVVCPSLKEGWGLTNIEANACGAPVVCADVPGLRDSAVNGETGLLYPYGKIDELAERLGRVLADAALRRQLTEGGLRWAERFHWDQAARETEEIIERVALGERFIDTPTNAVRPVNGIHAS